MSAIREYRCWPTANYGGAEVEWTWDGVISVDLSWVAGAKPWPVGGHPSVAIVLAGSDDWFPINIAYSDFMVSWQAARAGK